MTITHWPKRKLGEVADLCLGKMLDKKKNKGELHPYLGNIHVRWGRFNLEDLPEMRFENHEHDRYGLKGGDLVVCEGGEPGRCALWSGQVPDMKIQKALHRVRPHACLDSQYLLYWFLEAGQRNFFDQYFTGATIKHLPGEKLAKIEVDVPDLPTQRKIAGFLSAYDDLIENNLRRIRILEEMAQSLYREWFVHFRFPGHQSTKMTDSPLGPIPEGWERKLLGEIAEFRLGKMLDKKKNKGEFMPYLANVNVRWGKFELDDLREMRFKPDELDTYGLRVGDIVMCEGGEPGRCAVWSEQIPGMMIQKALHRIRCRENMNHSFLYHSLRYLGQGGHLAGLFTGATIKHLPRQQLAKVAVVVPPRSLLDAFIEFVGPIEDQTTRLEATVRCASKSRDLLLPKLLSGSTEEQPEEVPA